MTAVNFFTQTITLYNHSGSQDRYGNKSYSTGTAVKCKFRHESDIITDAQGQEIRFDGTCYVPLTTTTNTLAKVVFNSQNYKIVYIQEQRGTVTSLKHKKLYLQRYKV